MPKKIIQEGSEIHLNLIRYSQNFKNCYYIIKNRKCSKQNINSNNYCDYIYVFAVSEKFVCFQINIITVLPISNILEFKKYLY